MSGQCGLCGFDAGINRVPGRDAISVDCATCGEFIATGRFWDGLADLSDQDRRLIPYLQAHTRQSAEQGLQVEVTSDNWRDYALGHARTPVARKLEKLLGFIAESSEHPGAQVLLNSPQCAPLFDAASDDEVVYLVQNLTERGYLADLGRPEICVLTAAGWDRVEPAGGGIPGRCFVAMSFDPQLNAAYDQGIRSAIVDCGLEPIRVDRVHHNEKICDRIIAEIRQAQVVVADFTLQRAGVYFEAGFAMGLGRPVIWLCREDDLLNTHFDTRQYNHIVWTTPQDLRVRLRDRIRATIPTR